MTMLQTESLRLWGQVHAKAEGRQPSYLGAISACLVKPFDLQMQIPAAGSTSLA